MIFLEMEIFFVSVNIKYKMGAQSSKEENQIVASKASKESECKGFFVSEDISSTGLIYH